MSRNTSIALNDHLAAYIDEQVATGRYGSASEVVRAGLRLLQERDAQLAALRGALEHGERSGPATAITSAEFLQGMKVRAGADG
ncbi:MAG: toxin-antitoxin system CC2985 family antidote component [Oceanicaulis sp. HLUCCA04]|nr:MAG: toxin-antitoxin system CC2985 family antidote component [Oceanicaulis sp. HLUCCA04]